MEDTKLKTHKLKIFCGIKLPTTKYNGRLRNGPDRIVSSLNANADARAMRCTCQVVGLNCSLNSQNLPRSPRRLLRQGKRRSYTKYYLYHLRILLNYPQFPSGQHSGTEYLLCVIAASDWLAETPSTEPFLWSLANVKCYLP